MNNGDHPASLNRDYKFEDTDVEELMGFLDYQYDKSNAVVAKVNLDYFDGEEGINSEEIFPAYRFLEFAAKESNAEVLHVDEEHKELVFKGRPEQVESMYEDSSWIDEFDGLSEYHSWDEVELEEYNKL